MKLARYVVAASLLFAPAALAQDGPAPEGREERRERRGGRGGMGLPIERLTEELGLTPEQVTQAEAIGEEMRTAMREMFQNGGMEGGREKIREMFEAQFAKIEAILTPEQKEKFTAFREQMNERMQRFGGERGGPGGERGGPGNPGRGRARLREEALAALALSEEEASVVTPLLDATLTARETSRADDDTRRRAFSDKLKETTDPEAVNTLLAEFRAAREAGRATVKTSQDQLREVLTVDQEAKLVALGLLE
jgi:periplasmic protein CpxP/Spy